MYTTLQTNKQKEIVGDCDQLEHDQAFLVGGERQLGHKDGVDRLEQLGRRGCDHFSAQILRDPRVQRLLSESEAEHEQTQRLVQRVLGTFGFLDSILSM